MPDLNYLKSFYFVMKYGGFTKAAAQLHVQQPVVSRAVKLLELELNCQLIERQKKQVLLTPTGKLIFEYCETIFKSAEDIKKIASENTEEVTGILSFAASDSFAQGILGPIFAKFTKKYPKLRLSHHSGPSNLMLERIQKGEIDFGLFFNVPELPLDLSLTKLCSVEFEYVAKKLKSGKNHHHQAFIAHEDGKKPESLPLFKKYQKQFPQSVVSSISNSSMTRKSMVMDALGTSVLPAFMIKDQLDKGILISLMKPEKLNLMLLERKSSFRSKIKLEFIRMILEVVQGKN